MSADDFPPYPSDAEYPSEPVDQSSPYTPGNRPASGARRATPGEVLSQGFSGAQNAGDFLGLDVEFTGSQDQFAGGGQLELESAPMTHAAAPSEDDSAYPAFEGLAPQGAQEPDFPQPPSAFEFGEDLGSEEFVPAPAPRKRVLPAFAAVALIGVLAAAGVMYGPELYSRFAGGKPDEVASRPRDPTRKTPAKPAPDKEATPALSSGESSQPLVGAPGTPSAQPGPVEPAASGPESAPQVTSTEPSEPGVFDPQSPADSSSPAPGGLEPVGDLVASLLGAPGSGATPTGQPVGFPDLSGAQYEWASEDQLELIWRGPSVPMEAVFAPAKTMMPRVGNVRIFTNSGDIFEGRLYAVGQERVWIDAAPGRIGLDGHRIERIELLPADPQHQGSAGSAPSGKRVRVRVPGGVLYGRVLKVEGEDVTLALDDGGKVRVKSASVEELGSGRAVVVHR